MPTEVLVAYASRYGSTGEVAVFALGPVHSPHDAKEWEGSRTQLDRELARHPWLVPVAVTVLGGRFDPSVLRFPINVLAGSEPASDIRDWDVIRTLADALPSRFAVGPHEDGEEQARGAQPPSGPRS